MKIPVFHGEVGFNAQHSPMGAYFSFTCGHFGTRGGMGVQMGRPAGQDVFVGVKGGGRYEKRALKVLPFFEGAEKLDPRAAFLAAKDEAGDVQRLAPYSRGEIERRFGWGTDRWNAGELEFSVYSPFGEIPEPGVGREEELKKALLPAVAAEVRVDNRGGTGVKTGFFAINFLEGGVRVLEGIGEGRVGFGFRRELGVVGELMEIGEGERAVGVVERGAFVFVKWWPHEGLEDRSNPVHLLGTCGGIGFEVPAGKCYSLRLSLGCFVGGVVTTRLEGRYFYTRYFGRVEEVLAFAAGRFCELKRGARELDKKLLGSGLSADQQFLIAQGTRSYYGNTELLDIGGEVAEPYWVVNEGEYCMMNTLDLAVDQVFWELERNPWVVRNLLEGFLKRYSYVDRVKGETQNSKLKTQNLGGGDGLQEGGISFCHDQGTHNQFSPFGTSAYECRNLRGCFSFMTQEELCNWVLIATDYLAKTYDRGWAKRNRETFKACMHSMLNRDDSQGQHRKGTMQHDSAYCGSGEEITTYDSLNASLGRARENAYIATRRWVGIIGLEWLLQVGDNEDDPDMEMPSSLFVERDRCADYMLRSIRSDGTFPALVDEGDDQVRILPVIEVMVHAAYWERGFPPHYPYDYPELPVKFAGSRMRADAVESRLFEALRRHVSTLLSDKEKRNVFDDGGVKLSSSSDNSWLSKIAIVQHVARTVFNLDENGEERCVATPLNVGRKRGAGATGWERADAAHVGWLTTGAGAYWCACDQIVEGVAKGSRYYPRLVTMALWLGEVGVMDRG